MIERALGRMGRALMAAASAREHQRHHARATTPAAAKTQPPETPVPGVLARQGGLRDGERRWLWVSEVPFLACALAVLAWMPAQRALNPLICIVLVVAYAVACNVDIALGAGWAASCQLIFVPMLFIAPLSLVPLMVLAGGLGDYVARSRDRGGGPARCVLSLGDSWYALGPVLVLGAAGHQTFAWAHWPVYATALAVQLTVNAFCGSVRVRLFDGARQPLRDVVGVPSVVDIVLTVPALSIAAVALQAPVGAALTCAALLVIAGGFSSQRSGRLVQRDHATHDALTGLPNRLLFGELAAAAAERARRDEQPCAVMLVDLNAFKTVNDELGHQAGDQILVQAAGRLRHSVRAADSVARLGGDEFAVLLCGHQTIDACKQVADKLRRAFDVPFDLPAGPRNVGASVGVALIDGARKVNEALHDADIAMYADKQSQSTRFARHRDTAHAICCIPRICRKPKQKSRFFSSRIHRGCYRRLEKWRFGSWRDGDAQLGAWVGNPA